MAWIASLAARFGRALRAALAVLVSCALAPALLCSAPALAQQDDETRGSFRRGLDLFEQGRYEEAKKEFEKVIAANPSADLALEMSTEAGYQVFVEMLARKDDIATIARKILELAERGELRARQDAEKIQALIAKMFGDDVEESYRAMEELASRVGPFVVPFMVEHLADRRDNEKRVKAIVLLSKLGPDGTNAVIELLKHKDDYVRQNAAAILGHIRDFKAIPYLKALSDRRDESPHVRREAALALKTITGKDAAALESALVYFHALGERYYQEDPSVMVNNFKDWTVWEFKNDKLSYRLVPRHAWNEELAKATCYAALEFAGQAEVREAELDQIYTLLVAVFFQQHVEIKALLEVAEAKSAAGQAVDAAEIDALKEMEAKHANLIALATARGEVQILKALRKALYDRRVIPAIAMIETLRDIRMSESLLPAEGANLTRFIEEGQAPPKPMEVAPRLAEPAPAAPAPPPAPTAAPAPAAEPVKEPEPEAAPKPDEGGSRRRRVSMAAEEPGTLRTLQASGTAWGAALAAALVDEDKRVRYAAAEALLRLMPTRRFANYDRVVPTLATAVQESGSRVVLVVARDVQMRNRLVGEIRQMNHIPFGVASAKEGVLRARSSPSEDAIIIHGEAAAPGGVEDFSIAEFIDQIGQDYRTAGTPVVVIVAKKDLEEKTKQYEKAAAVLGDDLDAVLLKEKLESLWTGERAKPGDTKAKSTEVARRAASALAEAEARNPVFDLRQASSGLLAGLEFQPDVVRIPTLQALGHIHAREAVDKVAAIFDNPQNSKEVRIAAAYCLGECLRGAPMPQRVYDGLRAALKDGDRSLFQAAAEALGKASLTRDQARELFLEQRID